MCVMIVGKLNNIIINAMKKVMTLAVAISTALTASAGVYKFKMNGAPAKSNVMLNWSSTGEWTTLSATDGEAKLDSATFKPQYVDVVFGRSMRGTMYLDPKNDLAVTVDMETGKAECTGALADINRYLLNTEFADISRDQYGLEEAAFLKACDSVYAANKAIVAKATLPADFKKKEELRLKYKSYMTLPMYPAYMYWKKQVKITPSAKFFAKLDELTKFNAEWLECPEYCQFLMSAQSCYTDNMEGDDEAKKFKDWTDKVSDAKVKEYIVDSYVMSAVSSQGIDGNEALIEYFRKNVTDAEKTSKLNKLCDKWEALRAGKPSPTFTGTDINGKQVTLESLRGKYVYIDVWATWCGPCRGELPHLKKLEEAYKDKDIHFVSLSCDQNKEAWEKMVTKDQLKGIQLHVGPTASFLDEYMINGIPRFIILDREGKIVKAQAPRPSNPETAKLFDELLKK